MTDNEKRIAPPEGRSPDYIAGWHLADELARGGHDITHLEPPAGWDAEKRMGFRMRVLQAHKPADTPTLAPPAGCTPGFTEGWEAAEEWIRHGGPIDARDMQPEGMPGGMTPDQTAGFRGRILKELEPDSGQVLSFRPRPRPA